MMMMAVWIGLVRIWDGSEAGPLIIAPAARAPAEHLQVLQQTHLQEMSLT